VRNITSFPERFERLNQQVAEVVLIHALSPADHDPETLAQIAEQGYEEDYRACDLWIELKGGPNYGFMAAMPEYLRDYMDGEMGYQDGEKSLSFVSLGLLVVSQMTEEAILDALEKCLEEAVYWGVAPLGFRMSDDEDSPTE
jgi:hypothetical protein